MLPGSDVCSRTCMDCPGSVLCAECRPVFCDHPCTTENGWVSKPRVLEEVKRELSFPLPLPKHTKKHF